MKKSVYYIIGSCLLLATGCSNWLEVNPKNKVEQKEMFSDENGFKNALTGTYIKLKDSKLYGKRLTMEFCENLAQHWKTNPQDLDGYTSAYDYTNAGVEEAIEDMYGDFYNIIVNVNNLLDFIDNGVLRDDMYKLIKGEALAMRAFCHLDILRLFGPVPGEHNDDRILSYVRTVSRAYQPMHTWREYAGLLEQDLTDAETLLKSAEEKGMEDDFFAFRENRLNYWAVIALKARFYLWTQNKAKAAAYASMVIGNKALRLTQGVDFAARDLIASPEHIFSLHVYNLEEIANAYFFRGGGVSQDETKVKTDIFESDITDYRVTYLWNQIIEKPATRYALMKYKQEGGADVSLQQIPLIRLYEMYLIAIECSDDETVYRPLIDELVAARNISVLSVENTDKKNEFVAKEYQKEFYGEGQQFFQNKRRGDKNILWTDKEGGKDVYVLPLPRNEIMYN